jgi:drug/metabolite transporter (DMT)-like permease
MFTRTYSRPIAIALVILSTLLWSMAGVLTRHLDTARSFEVTFWRSSFCALTVMLTLWGSGRPLTINRAIRPDPVLLLSGLMWGLMFCCFMIALTLTSTSNTLVVSAAAPVLTTVMAWLVLRQSVHWLSWCAILMAASGMVWIFSSGVQAGNRHDLVGMGIAFVVPLASASNVILLKRSGQSVDLVPAVCLGALFSALAMLPLAWPLQTSAHDLGILAVLGCFQLALPCMLMVVASRSLGAPQISLLSLFESLLGPLWAWLGADEVPSTTSLAGGGIVILSMLLHELHSLYGVTPFKRR